MSPMPNRRDFLIGTGSAALLTGFTATARGYFANETINVGCIGTGGRCRHLLGALNELPGVRVTALCDVWETALDQTRPMADKQAFITAKHEELLSRSDVDAVIIAAPDHQHVPLTIAACEAGKDVYVEKPVTHDVAEGPKLIDAKNRTKRIIQVGTQQRSMPQFAAAKKIVADGLLGDVVKVSMTWNRNNPRHVPKGGNIDPKSVDWQRFLGDAPQQPFDEYRFRSWRFFWDFGGGIFTDLMVHHLDSVTYVLGLPQPSGALSVGDWFSTKGLWETPDTVQTFLQYPNGPQVHFAGTFSNARRAESIEIMGTAATLYLDRGRYELIPERHSRTQAASMILGDGPPGADFYANPNGEALHLANWLSCIRSRQEPVAPVEAGVAAANRAHLANRALRGGGSAKWKDAKSSVSN